MKTKSFRLPLLLAMSLVVFGAIGVMGAAINMIDCVATTRAPTAGGYMSGAAQLFNITLNDTNCFGESNGIVNLTVLIGSTEICRDIRVNVTSYNCTGTTYGTTDDSGAQTVTFRLYNASTGADSWAESTASVTPDNTNPGCTYASTLKSSITYAPTQTWTVTGYNASSATIQFGKNPVRTMTEASDVFTYTGTETSLPQGTYSTVETITSDGQDTTSCLLNSVIIDEGISLKAAVVGVATGQIKTAPANNGAATTSNGAGTGSSAGGFGGKNTLLLILVAVGGYLLWQNQKKKK